MLWKIPAAILVSVMFSGLLLGTSSQIEDLKPPFDQERNLNIALGDNRAEVIQDLGKPEGFIEGFRETIWFYPQQTLVFSEQELVDIRVLTKADREFQEAQRKQRLEQVKAREKEQETKARALKLEKLSDPQFLNLPAPTRLQFWQEFSHLYPNVDVLPQITAIRERMEEAEQREAIKESLAQIAREIRRLDDNDAYGSSLLLRGFHPHGRIPHRGAKKPSHQHHQKHPKESNGDSRSEIPGPTGIPNAQSKTPVFVKPIRGLPSDG